MINLTKNLLKKIVLGIILLVLIGYFAYKYIESINSKDKNETFILTPSMRRIIPFFSNSQSPPLPQKVVFWFSVLMSENPDLMKYYEMVNGNQIALRPEYGGDILGTITDEDTTTIIKPDGNKVDIREVIAFFGPPPQSTANWIKDFINTNPGAQRIRNMLKIIDRKLYIQISDTPNYFKLDNFDVAGNDVVCVRNNPDHQSTCKRNCDGNPNCIAFNDVKKNGVWGNDYGCCVKTNNIQNLKQTNNINFYIKDYSNSDYFQLNSFDAAGNDIQCYRNVDVDKCKQECTNDSKCVAYNEIKKNGAWGNDYGCCTKNSINTLSSFPTINTFIKKIKYLGYVDDSRIGEIKTEDGKWISIGDMFKFIAGPDVVEGFGFFDDIGRGIKGAVNTVVNTAKDVGNKIASGTMTAVDWTVSRANDVGNFATNAAKDVGSWAKNVSGDALNWAKGAGQIVVKNLVDIGNKIGDTARKAANTIKDTATNTINTIKTNVYDKGLKVAGNVIADGSVQAAMAVKKAAEQAINLLASFPEIARQAVNKAIEWLKGASNKVWDTIRQPLGLIINLILEGSECEYAVQRNISKLDAIKSIEPAFLPKMSIVIIEFVKSILNTASAGILTPILTLIMPFVEPYITPHISDLLSKAVETDEAVSAITTIADPVVDQVAKISCQFLIPPDINDITFNDNMDDNTLSSDTDWI